MPRLGETSTIALGGAFRLADQVQVTTTAADTGHRVVGRYVLHGEIAHGGMATVHFGRLVGEVGFSRTVAIKCLHPQYSKDPEFISMFVDEARLAARIRHPNVVPILDIVALDGELFMVMEYVQGETMARLLRAVRSKNQRVPLRIVSAIMTASLEGLHAAHEAVSERGEPLGIVHRDVSPQNIIVGLDGVARVLDFGVAKAAGRLQHTRDGQLKGKLAYMAPEQLRGTVLDRRTDVYAAAVVLWESLTGRRLFDGEDEVSIFGKVLEGVVEPPSIVVPSLPRTLDDVCLRGLQRDLAKRFQTAEDMAIALERAVGLATPREVGRWVEQNAAASLRKRAERIAEIESVSSVIMRGGQPLSSTIKGMGPSSQPASGPAPVGITTPGMRGSFTPSGTGILPPVPGTFPPISSPNAMRSGQSSPNGYAPGTISSHNAFPLAAPTSPGIGRPALDVEGPTMEGPVPSELSRPGFSPSSPGVEISRSFNFGASQPQMRTPQRSMAVVIALVGAVSAVVVSIVVVVVLFMTRRPATGPDNPVSGNSTPTQTSPIPGAPSSAVPNVSDLPIAPSSQNTATPPPTTGPKPTVKPPPTVAPPPTRPPPTATGKPGDCNPPYTLDAKGVRIPKPQCY